MDAPRVPHGHVLKTKNQENGLSVVSPKIERSENKLTLFYELEGESLAEGKAKSAHVFATITLRQGPALILHISWTGPEAEYRKNWPELLRMMTIPFPPALTPSPRLRGPTHLRRSSSRDSCAIIGRP